MAHTGKVKWFNSAKGYGFITPDNGSGDVFFHRREFPDDFDDIEADTPVTYVLVATPRGPAARNLRVKATLTSETTPAASVEEGAWLEGVVKWFDLQKGFGFVVCGGTDYFLSWRVVKESGLAVTSLQEETPVRFQSGPGQNPGSFAVTQLRLQEEEGEDVPSDLQPKMRTVRPSRKLRNRPLALGQCAVGRVTKTPQNDFCFLRVLALLSPDGKVIQECKEDAYDAVFLHISAFYDRWGDICEGDDITFTVIEGRREGQIAAGNAIFYREAEDGVEPEEVVDKTPESVDPMAEQLAALLPAEPIIGSVGVGMVTSYSTKTGSGKVRADNFPPLSFTKTSVDAGVAVYKGAQVHFEVVGELKKGLKIRITGLAEEVKEVAAERELAAAQ